MQSSATKYLRKLPPPVATFAKKFGVYPHYLAQAAECRIGYLRYGKRYKHNVLFVAGFLKSGTTWLENMLGCFPGYKPLLIPESQFHAPESGCFELPENTFSRMRNMLVVSKMHLSWTENNGRVLAENRIPYVVQYRDFRDIYVSNYFYVRNTPWHKDYSTVINMTMDEYVNWFIDIHTRNYIGLVDAWDDNRIPGLSMMLRYEDLIEDAFSCMQKVRDLYELPANDEELSEIVNMNSFKSLSSGRKMGEENNQSHFRKGVAGDWKNHFTTEHKDKMKEVAGEWLIRHGYESGYDW